MVANITPPRISSASTLSSVWETSVPSTTGSRSRARPSRRETISAREGSPRRAGSVADISTPIEVPCMASAKRGSASGSAALRIACQETARRHIDRHISPSATSTQVGLEASSAWPIGRMPIRSSASSAPPAAASAAPASSPRRSSLKAGRVAPSIGGSSDGSRRARERDAVGRARADPDGGARERALGLLDGARVLVGGGDLGGHPRPRVALRAAGGARGEVARAGRVEREVAQRLRQARGVAARDEQPVAAVRDDVAVARDVRGDDRRAGRERLREHHPERLAAQRRGAQHVGGLQRGALLGVADPPERRDALGVEQHRRELLWLHAHDGQLGGHLAAQRLEGAQQHRQPLALDGLADEHDPQRLPGRAHARRRYPAGRQVDAVGDHAVVAPVEAPAGPGGRLGDGDPRRQVVELAARAHQRGDRVRRAALGVAVERADQRRVGGGQGVPADGGRDRLVQVHDVEIARAQLPPQRRDGVRRVGEVRHRAVGRPADRRPERHQPLGDRALLRPRAAVQEGGTPDVGIERREHAHVVPGRQQRRGQGLDVPRHTARIRPGVRGDEGDPHIRRHPTGPARGLPFG